MALGVTSQITEVGDVVRIAVAPVFLLSGVGITLTLMTSRLARVVDRARALEQAESSTHESELGDVYKRQARPCARRA